MTVAAVCATLLRAKPSDERQSAVRYINVKVITVVIDETKSGDWAIGGRCLTTEAVLELAAGAAGARS